MRTMQSTLQLDWAVKGGPITLVIYEVTWPDEEPGMLFLQKGKAENCARTERKGIIGTIINRYVL